MTFDLSRLCVLAFIWRNLIPEICGQVLITIIGDKCITNTSSAIAPIYNLKNSSWEKSTRIDPEVLDIKYSEEIWYKNDNNWTKRNSLQLNPLDPIIFDRQWEGFPIFLTHANKSNTHSEYKMVATMNGKDIVVPFSLQIDQDAIVSICGVTFPVTCYQFILQGWGGEKSEFRICNNEVCNSPSKSKTYQHNNRFPKFLSDNKWNHLKIVKTGPNLKLFNRKGTVLMDYTDTKNTIINNVFFHSRNVNGLWKLHNYDYFFTKTRGESILKLKVPSAAPQCLSMFVTMCHNNCYMNIIISTDYYKEKWLDLQTVFNKEKGWNEVTSCIDVDTEYLYLSITTYCNAVCEPFWAFRNIRTSQKNKVKVLTVNPSLPWTGKCQYLKDESILEKTTETTSLDNWSRCKENEFGEDCMPCDVIPKDICLREKKYCQITYRDGMNHNRCYCSIGNKGPNCNEKCSYGSYGHSCHKSCSNCQDGCGKDTISGKCDTRYCTDNYEGDKCDQPPGLFLFDDSPTVKVGYTSLELILDSFRGTGNAGNMKRYRFDYRKKNHRKWKNAIKSGKDFEFNHSQWIKIENLEWYSTYQIRVFGYETEKDLEQLKHVEPKIFEFTTSCDEFNSSHVKITPNTTWATVNIVRQGASPICQLSQYQFIVNGKKLIQERTESIKYIANGLDPFTSYNLEIKKSNEKIFFITFKTKESTPGEVETFEIIKDPNEPSAITLKWTKPLTPNGNLLYYTLFITLISLFACNNSINRTSIELYIDINSESWRLTELKPYSFYYIGIVANTSAGFGITIWKTVETNFINQIRDEEIPPLTSVIVSINQASFTFESFACDHLMGPLKINITTKGNDPWCTKNANTTEQKMSNNITVTRLLPFCKYTATLQYIRNETGQRQVTTSFQTKEAAPNRITELLVTSKGPDHISLRWLSPCPPTGNLDNYQIKITYNSRGYWNGGYTFLRNDNITPSSCKLWPEFHCATVRNITRDYIYWLNVRSKNKWCDEYSDYAPIQAKAVETIPQPPYGLEAGWTGENYLVVQWFHPNETNGILLSFEILVNDEPYQMSILSENDYKLIYQKKVITNLTFPSSYNISVTAKNSVKCSKPEVIWNVKSPPPIPGYFVENITRNGRTIRVSFKQSESYYNIIFKRFLYILISECGTCENTLLEFKDKLMTHHSTSDEIEMATSVRQWARHPNPCGEKYLQEVTINDLHDYHIDENDTYYLGFIWIHKYHGYVRSNYNIKGFPAENPKNYNKNWYVMAGVIVFLILIVALSLLYLRNRIIIFGSKTKTINSKVSKSSTSLKLATEPIYVNQDELPLIQAQPKRTRYRNSIRPLSILITEEICPGTPAFKTQNSERVKLNCFLQYVRDAIESGELERQHTTLPQGQTQEWTHGVRIENKPKNRYQNMIAYDHTRVVLDKLESDEHSDYINANFIDGYRHPRAYIATQGPKKNTVIDFWRMIWQERVTHIIVMTNVIEGGKKKTEQYWPNANEEETFGDFRVSHLTSEMYANYEYRKFEVQYRYLKPRKVGQVHFKVWPDHGIPLYAQSLVPVLERMLKMRSTDFPLVVHCSAGVGRTGTVILCDICLRMAAAEGYVDAFSMLEHIRSQRPNMVDNPEQYKLAHLVILNCLMGLKTGIPLNEDFETTVIKNQDLDLQLEYIRSCEWQDDAMKTVGYVTAEPSPIIAAKNRFVDIFPDRTARVYLHPYPATNPSPSSTYINAVQVDGFCHPGRFVVTQFPLPDYIGDFWRLIAEKETSVIVCLNGIPTGDPTCRPFWPVRNGEFRPVDVICVNHVKTTNLQAYSILSFELSTSYEYQGIKSRPVDIVHFHNWKYPAKVPDYSDFITFVEDATVICRRSPRVLVTCYDGATASGLFVALTFLMEKIKLERECDVCQAVRSIRTSRKEFTNCREQLEFLYKASILYVQDKFLQYSNSSLS